MCLFTFCNPFSILSVFPIYTIFKGEYIKTGRIVAYFLGIVDRTNIVENKSCFKKVGHNTNKIPPLSPSVQYAET